MERRLRLVMPFGVLIVLAAVIGAIDLATNWLGDGWRIDALLIGTGSTSVWAHFNARRAARRIRTGESRRQPTRRDWVRAIGSMIGTLVFMGVFG